ncbi:MAG: hypothetical protein IIA07_05960 [Proteobacteria bacterium]|nr:hypothetical protein [Pseudomonadota bacterium]
MSKKFWPTDAHHVLCIVVLALSSTACADSPAQFDYRDAPSNVLFVGNSFIYYNNSLHKHYSALVRSSKFKFATRPITRSMTISGAHLPEHEGGLPGMLAAEDWDVVIMQGYSLGPISEATAEPFRKAARDYSTLVREQGGRPVFFMTWAYAGKPEMTSQLNVAYTEVGRELGAQVVPVGLAFATVTDARPDIVLRIAYAKHPTLAGTYLAACTFFATLFNQSPEGLEYSAGLDINDAAYLQGVAWQTVLSYQD